MKRIVESALHARLLVTVLALLLMAAGYWGYKKLPYRVRQESPFSIMPRKMPQQQPQPNQQQQKPTQQ